MSVDNQNRFDGGIADYKKLGQVNESFFQRSVDTRSDANELTLLPKTNKESGSVVTDLPIWGERVLDTLYAYGQGGNLYARTLAGSVSLLRSVSASQGNGLEFYGEDGYLYYTRDKVIGRYGPLTFGTASFSDDFLGSEGGVPTNTHSANLEASSSQHFNRADTSSLSITSDITIEAYIKPESLPAVGSSQTIVSKWDESGTLRSYKLDILGISGVFGDGTNGALTISSNTTQAPTDASCSGTSGTNSLSATNVSFATGQEILIIQMRGTGAGTKQRTKIASYSTGTITTEDNLNFSYNSTGSNKAQVIVLPRYTNVTVNSGVTWTAKAWDGTVGGVLAFLANGTVTINGTISADGKGFIGGTATSPSGTDGVNNEGKTGEGTTGASISQQNTSNGNGGGGGYQAGGSAGGGGGGGHATTGTDGGRSSNGGDGGTTAGTADLTTIVMGGGGGSGGTDWPVSSATSGAGGNGGGIVAFYGSTLTINSTTGLITANGATGGNASGGSGLSGGGGGGAGGSVAMFFQTGTLNTNRITVSGGSGGNELSTGGNGGAGSVGRIHASYLTSVSGSTSPTLVSDQDNSLSDDETYQIRFSVSSNGSTVENLTKIHAFTVDTWSHVAAAWDASAATVEFFINGSSIGTTVGTVTSIHDNASDFSVGAMENSGGSKANFFDGDIDDVRVWSTLRTASQIYNNKDLEISGSSANLAAYYQFDNSPNDSTGNANNLTAVNTPTYTTTVPFASPTTRLDLDQQLNTTGNTYTIPIAISESATDKQEFIPGKDPQKSIEVLLASKGTGNLTITVHDALNKIIATKTITNANLPSSGDYEFVFDDVWRPVIGQTYHFHLTSTVADGTVTTTTSADLNTVDFHTYYQFLVNDKYHPAEKILNFVGIGNERYLATYSASAGYNPHRLTFPSGLRVRSIVAWNEYWAIGCFRGENIYSYDEGIIFFWDGISDTYNYAIQIPEGGINAMASARGLLTIIAGYKGDMLEYSGGSIARKVKRVPKVCNSEYIETLPGSLNYWQALLRWGVCGDTDCSMVERGVYTYGGFNENKPNSLTYDYPISTGSRTSDVEIGMVIAVDTKLLIGWRDGINYGIDSVSPGGDCFTTGTYERLIIDKQNVWKEKKAQTVRADFEPLLSGQSVTVKYKKDRESSWKSLSTSTVGHSELRLPIIGNPHREIQIAVDLGSSTGVSPTLYELSVEENLQNNDQML